MSKQVKNILKEATEVLDRIENGRTYPTSYVISRLEQAAERYPEDHLIGNMRDVISKAASNNDFITQKQIGMLYDKMYGFSGGQTGFRNSLEDLLPADRQIQKVAYKNSSLRTMEEKGVAPLYKDSELSNAFSVLFSMGGNASFASFKPGQDKSVEKSVISKLSSLGHAPSGVDILHSNDHFVLCSANYKTSKFNKISTLIPVQITDGVTREPQHIILGGLAVNLDKESLYTAIKEAEKDSNSNSKVKFASQRDGLEPEVEVAKAVVPNSLKKFTEMENTLIAAASKFSTNDINIAIATLDSELRSFGIKNAEIKIASSNPKAILFSVNIPTKLGKSQIKVPVEIHNGMAALPSKFAAETSSEEIVYDFSKEGFVRFASSLKANSTPIKIARDTGEMADMSYQQLLDRMVDGVANKDYRLAEDSLSVIQRRFGGNQYLVAFDQFTQLLKHSSSGSARDGLIKEAFDKGYLIKVPTSVELYCPSLGLPVSKVAFDDKGRPIPAGRRTKSENQVQDTIISSSRIVFS